MTAQRNTLLLLAVLALGLGLLAAVLSVEPACPQNWTYADVAAMDAVDTANPENDIIALYGRICGGNLEIRLDFLQGTGFQGDVQITVETASRAWMIALPAGQQTGQVITNGDQSLATDILPRRDQQLDSIVIQISPGDLPKRLDHISVTARLNPPGDEHPLDQVGPIRLGGAPPPPAPLILAFWDTFSAATPAAALRSWNGAHSGPLGQRHGLSHLLQAAAEHNIAITLLDLKTSAALAALDTVDGMPLVRQMEQQGLVTLPDSAIGSPETAALALDFSREAAARFGLRPSLIAFGPLQHRAAAGYESAYSSLTPGGRIYLSEGMRLIPLPLLYSGQQNMGSGLTPEGQLTIQTKRDLLGAALSDDRSDLVVLGGSLPASLWADVYVAPAIMAYLAGHPWIDPLNTAGLNAFPSHKRDLNLPPGCRDLLCNAPDQPIIPTTTTGLPFPNNLTQFDLQNMLINELPQEINELLPRAAWESFFQLTQPSKDLQRQALQANNLDAVAHLLAAAKWAENPVPLSTCRYDIDHDGQPECQLASTTVYAAIEADDGRLALLVYKNGRQISQIVAPTSQFTVGLSDPGEWQLEYGSAADPDAMPGGFVTSKPPYAVYSITIMPEYLELSDAANSVQKSYRLLPDGMLVDISSGHNTSTIIPLLLTGGLTPEPGWDDQRRSTTQFSAQLIEWQLFDGQRAQVIASGASFSTTAFFDSLAWMSSPEDPNRHYTSGHQLPYPFAAAMIESAGPYQIRFQFGP